MQNVCPYYLTLVSLLLTSSSLAAEGQIRLVDGSSRCSGRVEVYREGEWGTVCDDHWDWSEAEVVCRQLDCGKALKATHRAHFGRGHGRIWLDDVDCSGNESSLTDCHYNKFGRPDCDHAEDAGVVCSGTQSFVPLDEYLLVLVLSTVGGLLLPLVFAVAYLLHKRRSTMERPKTVQMSAIALNLQEKDSTYEVLQSAYTYDYGVINKEQFEHGVNEETSSEDN